MFRMSPSSLLLLAPFGAPFFLRSACGLLIGLACCLGSPVLAADDVATKVVAGSDFSATREALVEAIEAEGLVVSAVIPFNQMLARTAGDLAKSASPFVGADIVQFCSSQLAWQLLEEDVSQIALCPLSIAVYTTPGEPAAVVLAWRMPGQGSAGRGRAEKLLRKIVDRAAELARLRW